MRYPRLLPDRASPAIVRRLFARRLLARRLLARRLLARRASEDYNPNPRLRVGLTSLGLTGLGLWVAICATVHVQVTSAGELHTLAGKVLTGDLQSANEKAVVFKDAKGSVSIPVGEIIKIELNPTSPLADNAKFIKVELTDGSILQCKKIAFRAKELDVTLLGSDLAVKLPIQAISYILNDAEDASVRQQWDARIWSKRGNRDLLAIKRDGILNPVEGTLGVGNDKGEISFESEAGGTRRKGNVDPTKVQGMVFMRPLNLNAPAPLCKVYDLQMNVFVAAKMTLEDNRLSIITVGGAEHAFLSAIELNRSAIHKLDYTNDKVAFLSDLKPVELIEKSKQGRKDTLHLDKNLDNGPLQLKGETFTKGLAIHAHTEVTYSLEGKYKKLEAVLGMDDAVGGDGKPMVKIEADGKELFAHGFIRQEERKAIELDVRGVRHLRITVTSKGLFDFGDHIDIANAKLTK